MVMIHFEGKKKKVRGVFYDPKLGGYHCFRFLNPKYFCVMGEIKSINDYGEVDSFELLSPKPPYYDNKVFSRGNLGGVQNES